VTVWQVMWMSDSVAGDVAGDAVAAVDGRWQYAAVGIRVAVKISSTMAVNVVCQYATHGRDTAASKHETHQGHSAWHPQSDTAATSHSHSHSQCHTHSSFLRGSATPVAPCATASAWSASSISIVASSSAIVVQNSMP
jgi:hypothetical protein